MRQCVWLYRSASRMTEQDMTPEQLEQRGRAKLAMILKKLQKKRVKVDGKRVCHSPHMYIMAIARQCSCLPA